MRLDPIQGLIAGKSDPFGQDRILERDKDKALPLESTLNRLELSAEAIDARYHKIQSQPDKIEQLLIKRGVKAIPRKSAENGDLSVIATECLMEVPPGIGQLVIHFDPDFALDLTYFISPFVKRPR